MALVTASAHDIDTSGLELRAELPVEWLAGELADADVTVVAAGAVVARLSRTDERVIVRGAVRASLSAPCARCLAPVPLPIDAELTLLLAPEKPAPHEGRGGARGADRKDRGRAPAKHSDDEYEFTADEADVDSYDGETVVLDGFLREAILLELPNFPLCSDACPGIRPPAASAEVSKVDVRLRPLELLRQKLAAGSDPATAPGPLDSPGPMPVKKNHKE